MMWARMKLGTSTRGTVLPALIAVMVVAGVSMAVAGQPDQRPTGVSPSHAPDRGTLGSKGNGESSGAADDGTQDGTSSDDGAHEGATSAECTAAVDVGQVALQDETGLAHAIEVLLANCGRDHGAQGLVNALQHVQQNLDGQQGQGSGSAGSHGNKGGASADHSQSAGGQGGSTTDSASGDRGSSATPGANGNGGSSAEHRANG